MSKALEKILSQPWGYFISRNLPLWHDSLYFVWGEKGYKRFGLPDCLRLRVHRGDLSEFYYLNKGIGSSTNFDSVLAKKLDDPKYIKFLEDEYKKECKKLVGCAKKVVPSFSSLNSFFIFYGKCNCLLDITAHGSKVITNKLLDLLKDVPDKEMIMTYYAEAKELSPIQKLEREVARLHGKTISVANEARRLCEKYAWIPVSFIGEPWDINYFINLIENYQPRKNLKRENPKEKISKEAKYYLKLLGRITYLNEFRKAAFSQACFEIRPSLDKIAKDYGLESWKQLNFLTHDEILNLLKGEDNYQKKLIEKRKNIFVIYQEKLGEVKFLYGEDVLEFEKKFKPKAEGATELKGVVANRGMARGEVKIISGPVDFYKFKKGDILIAKMTSVDFIPIMKKAAAFVTDEGGLACHAAVVSREYGVPCIVGTGLATVAFKDGDEVEVDAERGIVKKLVN